jgi:hypothetical protein
MGQRAAPPKVTWQSLNKRQQDYLTAIYQADQEVEAAEHSRRVFAVQSHSCACSILPCHQ